MTLEELAIDYDRLRVESDASLSAGDLDEWLSKLHMQFDTLERLEDALLSEGVHVVRDERAARIVREIDLSEIEDVERKGEEMLYSWFNPRQYAAAISRVDSLISPIPVPGTLRTFVDEARQCYAFEQSNAVYSLCRTILEAAVNDLCVRIGRMPKYVLDEALFSDPQYTFPKRLRTLASPPGLFTRIYDHYRLLCRVVHGSTTVNWGESLAALVETIGYVHHLYAVHQHMVRTGPT